MDSTSVMLADDLEWAPFGVVRALEYGNGLRLWKSFTSNYDIDGLEVMNPSNSTILSEFYHSYTDGLNLTNVWDNINSAQHKSYWYDNTNKLMDGVGPWGGFNYYYDAAGNRTWRTLSVGGTTTERRYWHVNGSGKR